MENINLEIIFNSSELAQAKNFFKKIHFEQEMSEFDRFETMLYEGNLIIYKQTSVKLLQSFRVLSKSIISQIRNFSTTPQNLARVFVRISNLFSDTSLPRAETVEKVTVYSDFLKMFVYKISIESKKDENPIFEKILELILDLVLYGGFEDNFTVAPPQSSLSVVPAVPDSKKALTTAMSSSSQMVLMSPEDMEMPSQQFINDGQNNKNQQQQQQQQKKKKDCADILMSPDDL